MKINKEIIAKLNPCKDRFDNFLKFYDEREFTKRQFMGLKNITHCDKLWVAFRLMDIKQITLACCDIAQSVLHIYENKYPNDKRVRECIEATRLYSEGKITADELREKRAACAAAAYAATAACAAAAYAATAACATAAYAATAACAATKKSTRNIQEKLNRTIVLKYWK